MEYFQKAIAANGQDQLLYRDLALVLSEQKKTAEAIALLEGMPQELPARFDIVLWLAEAYVGEKRYDDSLALLKGASLAPRRSALASSKSPRFMKKTAHSISVNAFSPTAPFQ